MAPFCNLPPVDFDGIARFGVSSLYHIHNERWDLFTTTRIHEKQWPNYLKEGCGPISNNNKSNSRVDVTVPAVSSVLRLYLSASGRSEEAKSPNDCQQLWQTQWAGAEQQVEAFLKSKGISLDVNNLETCQPIPRSDEPEIIIKVVNQKQKPASLKQDNVNYSSN